VSGLTLFAWAENDAGENRAQTPMQIWATMLVDAAVDFL
jgi:hypothetical protein